MIAHQVGIQKNKLFITYYDINTKKCILKKQYETRLELGESVLKSCHLPYLINGKVFYKTEEGVRILYRPMGTR